MLRTFSAVSVAVLVVAGSTACATKNFVRNDVKPVNDKVDSLGRSVEETQERTRKNEGTIGDVDKKAQAAQSSADSARQAAADADTEAKAARARANEVGSKADDFDKSQRRLVYTVVLSEDEGQFKSGKALLPDDAKVKLDELVTKLKADPNGAYFEIEGHTDALGTKASNEKIGLDRAEAVKRYLFEQHQIPLHRMNVISYGMDKPVASNKTREGRAQNRRVVIRVLV
jgi:outer membrane protein OmpA-like peptidoglycan-associated protein